MTAPGPLIATRRVGAWTVHAIQAGGQRLDGGAMFGVVPKTLWERRLPADERNRIQFGMRCLLVEHADELILIDTGAGNKENAKFHEIYVVENTGVDDTGMGIAAAGASADVARHRTLLEDGVRAAGHSLEDVTLVINTHLHFDHAGGNTYADSASVVRPSFPRARYVVQAGEYDWATHTNERTAASYFVRNWESVRDAGRLELISGSPEIIPGVSALRTPGHVPHHQSVLLRSDGETACFLGDICPTATHLPLPWIMGYDVEPLVTLETKRWLFERAAREQWLMIFEHDANVAWGRIAHDGKSYGLT